MKVEMIPIDRLIEPKEELRSVLVKENLEELAESIKELGILEPLIVRPVEDKYEIVAGHRRFLAAQMAELKEVPCIVKELNDRQVLLERLHENLKREELNVVDQAGLIHKLWDREGLSYKQIGELFGKSESWARDLHRIHFCDDEIKDALIAGHIKKTHAYMLMKHPDKERRLYFLQLCIENGASPRTLDIWIRDDLGTLQYMKEMQPVQRITDIRPEIQKVMLSCAICNNQVPSDAMYIVHLCKDCYETLMQQKAEEGR